MDMNLITIGMHTCFSYFLALQLEKHLQYSIDIALEHSFR